MKCGQFLLCFTLILCSLQIRDAVSAPRLKLTNLLANVNTGMSEMMKVAQALNDKDYIQALLIFIDFYLETAKKPSAIISFSLEESRPALKLLRTSLQVFHPDEESEYYGLKFAEKLKIVFSSWKENVKESSKIMKRYFEAFVENVKSGEFKERVSAFIQKMINKVKRAFPIFFKKRRH